MAIFGVYLDSTALKRLRRFGRSAEQRVWIWRSGILHASPIFSSLIHRGPSVQSWRDKHKEAHKTLSQYRYMRQHMASFDVLKISGGEAYLTRTTISRSPLSML